MKKLSSFVAAAFCLLFLAGCTSPGSTQGGSSSGMVPSQSASVPPPGSAPVSSQEDELERYRDWQSSIVLYRTMVENNWTWGPYVYEPGLNIEPVTYIIPGDQIDDDTIRGMFVSLYEQGRYILYWQGVASMTEVYSHPELIDQDLPAIPVDPSELPEAAKYWPPFEYVPLTTFQNKEEVCDAFYSIFAYAFADKYLGYLFEEEYAPDFPKLKEIDGRLYCRALGYGAGGGPFNLIKTMEINGKSTGCIQLSVTVWRDMFPDETYAYEMLVQNGSWVLSRFDCSMQ